MYPENVALRQRVESGEASLDEIKAEFRRLCDETPLEEWLVIEPDLQLGIDSVATSPLLPRGTYRLRNGEREVLSYSLEVEIFLTRSGAMLEKLVHYDESDFNVDKVAPDEILGETSQSRYRGYYPRAIEKLQQLPLLARMALDRRAETKV